MNTWIEGIVHTLALNYHWSKTEILDTIYLDEAFFYIDNIRITQNRKILLDMAVTITPHLKENDRKDFYKSIENDLKKLENQYTLDSDEDELPEAGAFEKLRAIFKPKIKK